MLFYDVWSCNVGRKETKTKKYNFLPDDEIGYRIQEGGSRVIDEEDPDEIEPNGRLKAFMEKYSISNMGVFNSQYKYNIIWAPVQE